ncbi:MAG: hypothetical protein ACFFDT_19535, partial [Candidatus Hodarchaeota archaeon]
IVDSRLEPRTAIISPATNVVFDIPKPIATQSPLLRYVLYLLKKVTSKTQGIWRARNWVGYSFK